MTTCIVEKIRLTAESSALWALRYGRTHSGPRVLARRLGRHPPPAAPFGARSEPGPIMVKVYARGSQLVNKKVIDFLADYTVPGRAESISFSLNEIHSELKEIRQESKEIHSAFKQIRSGFNRIRLGWNQIHSRRNGVRSV
jgi:hypothetical protein